MNHVPCVNLEVMHFQFNLKKELMYEAWPNSLKRAALVKEDLFDSVDYKAPWPHLQVKDAQSMAEDRVSIINAKSSRFTTFEDSLPSYNCPGTSTCKLL